MLTLFKKIFKWLIIFIQNRNIIRENGELIGFVGFDGFISIEKVRGNDDRESNRNDTTILF